MFSQVHCGVVFRYFEDTKALAEIVDEYMECHQIRPRSQCAQHRRISCSIYFMQSLHLKQKVKVQ